MFLRWLLGTFPREMREGWALVRPDFLLWAALSALSVLSSVFALSELATLQATPPEEVRSLPVLPFLVSMACALLTGMLPAVLFAARSQGRQLTWTPILALLAGRLGPFLGYGLVGFLVVFLAGQGMTLAVTAALGDSAALEPLATIAGWVVRVSIVVRFSFLPFLVMLCDRDRVPAEFWKWKQLGVVAAWFWPLTASARLVEGRGWSLAFYAILGQTLPAAALQAPASLVFPLSIAVAVLLVSVQAVLFLHFRARCAEVGVPPPQLPAEPALAA